MDKRLSRVRGTMLPLLISKLAGVEDILAAALVKFKAHDRHFDSDETWQLHYPDGTLVSQLPETDFKFVLRKYREQILKNYQKITLFLAPGISFFAALYM